MMIRTKSSKQIDMTKGPILKGVVLFAIPLILSGILSQLFNTADSLMVGRWGGDTPKEREIALAAVGSCSILIMTIINLFSGFSTGTTVLISQEIGAKEEGEAEKTVHTSVVLAVVCGLICTAIGILGARPLLQMIGTNEELLDDAVAYMRAYFLGVPAQMLYTFCAAVLIAKGDSKRPMVFLMLSGVVNVVLNALAVVAMGLGALGVGIATAISQWVALAAILTHMSRMEGPCRIRWKRMRADGKKLGAICRIGIPASIESVLFSFSSVFTQSAVNAFGSAVVAGNSAASNVETYLMHLQTGFVRAGTVYVGQNVGAKNFGRVLRSMLISVAAILVVGSVFGALLYVFAEPTIALFAPGNPEVIRAGVERAIVTFLPYPLWGIMCLGSGLLRGLGRNVLPAVISISGCFAYRVFWVEVIYRFFFNGNAAALYMVYPTSWVLTSAALYVAIAWVYRRKSRETFSKTLPEKSEADGLCQSKG